MYLVNHGAKCCGIKHIYSMSNNPTDKVGAVTNNNVRDSSDRFGRTVSSDKCCFRGERPQETAAERLDAFIEFTCEWRPSHLIEVVIVPRMSGMRYQEKWVDALKERGFHMVTEFKNSNSSHSPQVWHLVLLEGKPVDRDGKPVPYWKNRKKTVKEKTVAVVRDTLGRFVSTS